MTKIIRYIKKNLSRLFSTDSWEIDLWLVATFEKFLENLGSLVLHLCREPQRILPLTVIFERKNKVHSAKFKQARKVSSLLNTTKPRVTDEKFTARFLDEVVVLVLRVCTWVFKFPVKHSRSYNNCSYSRGCKYDLDFLIRADFCFTFLCA